MKSLAVEQGLVLNGASGRSRTGTPVKARDFKSLDMAFTSVQR